LKIRNERLDKSPPTARLFGPDNEWALGVKGWSLECQIAQAVLEELVADVLAHRADTISTYSAPMWLDDLHRYQPCGSKCTPWLIADARHLTISMGPLQNHIT
jgi:hypothetical protein